MAQRKRARLALLGLLLAAGVAVAMIQYKVPTILGPLMALFAMDAEAASWLMSIFTLASVFAALPSGLLARRFGAKNMMVAALGIAVAGSCIGLAAGSSAALVASRAVEGVALTILTTCGPLVVRACVDPGKVGTAMGIWGVWGCVGSTAAAVVTPTVFEAMGFAGVWTVFAVGAVLAAVLVLAAIRMPRARTAAEEAKAAESGAASGRSRGRAARGLWRMLLTRDILLFLGGFAMFNVCPTTRAPRPGEQDGVHYFFLSREEFESTAQNGGMLEYASYNGNYYGTPKAPMEQKRAQGIDVILEIEVQGALQVKKACPDALMIFVAPPGFDELQSRLTGRHTEDEETVQKRLAIARQELKQAYHYDYVVVNDTVSQAVDRLSLIVEANRLNIHNMKEFLDEVNHNA